MTALNFRNPIISCNPPDSNIAIIIGHFIAADADI